MDNINKLGMESEDIVDDNIKKIQELFPDCVTETADGLKINYEQLKQELSKDIVDDKKERYELTWPGKKEAILEANTPTTKTLRPIRKKSVDFDNTQNIYIEGDNLEALKILQESYLGKVKCIYIDPPYNTGNDFIYKDNFKKDLNEEGQDSGELDEESNKLIANQQSNGRFHSDWLSMMYPRLKLARNLLRDDGVIFISNDENEYENLKKICDEIFGNSNFIENFIWGKNSTKNNSTTTSTNHEYILCFAKNIEKVKEDINLFRIKKEGYDFLINFINNCKSNNMTINNAQLELRKILAEHKEWKGLKNYKFIDKDYNIYREDNVAAPGGNGKIYDVYHPITHKKCKSPNGGWRYTEEKMKWLIENNLIVFGDTEEKVPQFKRILQQMDSEVSKSIIIDNNDGIKELNKIFNIDNLFDNPKPTSLIEYMLKMVVEKNDIILDFFSGSATTAHATMQLNAEDNGNRKFIMVQLPEQCSEKSEAYKSGYKNICEIGEERIRRAAKKIKEATNADIDYGFRVYKVDSSNVKNVYYEPDKLNQNFLDQYESNVKDDRTPEDLLTQIILDLGLTLDLKVEEKQILNNKVYYVGGNSLVACLDKEIDVNIIPTICECKPEKIVFKENGFNSDSDKINAYEKINELLQDSKDKIYIL